VDFDQSGDSRTVVKKGGSSRPGKFSRPSRTGSRKEARKITSSRVQCAEPRAQWGQPVQAKASASIASGRSPYLPQSSWPSLQGRPTELGNAQANRVRPSFQKSEGPQSAGIRWQTLSENRPGGHPKPAVQPEKEGARAPGAGGPGGIAAGSSSRAWSPLQPYYGSNSKQFLNEGRAAGRVC